MTENKRTPRKYEFILQLAIIVLIILGVLFKSISWLFWILAAIGAAYWIYLVHKDKKNDGEDE